MRAAVILSAITLAAAVAEAGAQQTAATGAQTASNPVARFVGAVREKLNGPPPPVEAQPARPRKKQTRRYRRSPASRSYNRAGASRRGLTSRSSQKVPWPVAAGRRAVQASNVTVLRTSVVRRPIVRTILVNDELLPLPAAEFVGEPVKLHVPSIGDVEIPEDRYPQVFKLLVSESPTDKTEALRALREIRDATDALRHWARSKGRLKNPDQSPQ